MAIDWLSVLGPSTETPRWLIIDVALFKDKRSREHVVHQWAAHSVFAGTALEAFGELAPCFTAMPTDPALAATKIQRMMDMERGVPAFSIFESSSSEVDLHQLFAYLGSVRIDGDLRMHCRFADTRILPRLLAVLSSTQRMRIAREVRRWSWVDHLSVPRLWRSATLGSVPVGGGEEGDEAELLLNHEQYADLLFACEPDTVFWQLLDNTPELVPETNRGSFRDHLELILRRADSLNLETSSDRLQFTILSLGFGDEFYRQPLLATTWQAIDAGSTLERQMEKWEDGIWTLLEEANGVRS